MAKPLNEVLRASELFICTCDRCRKPLQLVYDPAREGIHAHMGYCPDCKAVMQLNEKPKIVLPGMKV